MTIIQHLYFRFKFNERSTEFQRIEHKSRERRKLAGQCKNDCNGILDHIHRTRFISHGGL